MDKEKKNNIFHLPEFLERKIQREMIEIGGKSAQQLEKELEEAGIDISPFAQEMLHSPAFTTLPNPQILETVRVKTQDLGFRRLTTTHQIYQRAMDLGLELCPAEVGPHLRLKDTNQPLCDSYSIAMRQIPDHRGFPLVFGLERDKYGLSLIVVGTRPDNGWRPEEKLVFSLPKGSQLKSKP
jgi:hypothetical protein